MCLLTLTLIIVGRHPAGQTDSMTGTLRNTPVPPENGCSGIGGLKPRMQLQPVGEICVWVVLLAWRGGHHPGGYKPAHQRTFSVQPSAPSLGYAFIIQDTLRRNKPFCQRAWHAGRSEQTSRPGAPERDGTAQQWVPAEPGCGFSFRHGQARLLPPGLVLRWQQRPQYASAAK